MKDFVVISRIAQVDFMVLAHPDVPAKNLPELIAYAKANPDTLAVATDGARRFSGMIAAWLNKLAGTPNGVCALHADEAQGIQDAIAGRVQLVIIAVPTARGHVASGKLKAAGGDRARAAAGAIRRVQAVAQTFAGFDFPGWWVLAAPAGVPNDVVARVNKEIVGGLILTHPEVVERMNNMGFASTPAAALSTRSTTTSRRSTRPGARWFREMGLQPE